jgi:hypothetical protein
VEVRMEEFVHTANVERFLDVMATDVEPARRRTLQQLLLEEENKLGKTIEQLDNVARWIEQGRQRIAKIRDIASRNDFSEEHHQRAIDLLATLQHTQSLLEEFHHRLDKTLNDIEA